MNKLSEIYNKPIKSSRSGSLFMAFSYPTKISPETIAIYILAHTKPGDRVLDAFGGSGTTGLATLLCDQPNEKLKELVKATNLNVEYGPRTAYISEISGIGSFISEVMSSKIESENFKIESENLIKRTKKRINNIYNINDLNGEKGLIRHIIHTEFMLCINCAEEISFADACVNDNPISISDSWTCPNCKFLNNNKDCKRVIEKIYDPILNTYRKSKKRRPFIIYGQTGNKKWKRRFNTTDFYETKYNDVLNVSSLPLEKMHWGDLHRSGYHENIEYVHDFYTLRNLTVLSVLWDEIKNVKEKYKSALKLWILSYNASHSTLMTRVVLKKNQKDFILTGAQPGVLYISSLPVEKNIITGLERKIKTFYDAFKMVEKSSSTVYTHWASSTSLKIEKNTIDYVFTDPPFGDYIPYSELNFINEAWLERMTNQEKEAIVSKSQNKNITEYQSLLTKVFLEINKTLKETGLMSVVFHSASSNVWNALSSAFNKSSFTVINNTILDKEQESFKQTNSITSVKGDAILLLKKEKDLKTIIKSSSTSKIIDLLIKTAQEQNDPIELEPQRLYSRYVGYCMSNKLDIKLGAKEFYDKLSKLSF